MTNRERSILDCSRKHNSTPDGSKSSVPSGSRSNDIGILGENLVAEWLQGCGWKILQRRWRCPWGEIDLIARGQEEIGNFTPRPSLRSPDPSSIVIFVEVKTRRRGNWDADGRLAIGQTKQAKLWQAAELFLRDRPALAHLPCRFDVALVRCDPAASDPVPVPPIAIAIGQPVAIDGYRLTLQDYIPAAFSL